MTDEAIYTAWARNEDAKHVDSILHTFLLVHVDRLARDKVPGAEDLKHTLTVATTFSKLVVENTKVCLCPKNEAGFVDLHDDHCPAFFPGGLKK